MISDVLFDAVSEIRRYQRDFNCYEDTNIKEHIDSVVTAMDQLRQSLDTLPPESELDDRSLPESKE